MTAAKYVVFDGMDGSGKGTQIGLLQRELKSKVIFTREPGGTQFAEEIRALVRDNPLASKSTPLNNFLLFWAAREELLENLVAPALTSGKHVFSDRGDSSTYAFQLWGEEQREFLGLFNTMRTHVFEKAGRREPDLYVIFDLPAEAARERVVRDSNRNVNHFDARDLAYYERVRGGFLSFAKQRPKGTVALIDATVAPGEVHRSVLMLLAERLVIPEFAFLV